MALLLTAVTGAWADVDLTKGASYDFTTITAADFSSLANDYWSVNDGCYSNNNYKPTTATPFQQNSSGDEITAFAGLKCITGNSSGRVRIYTNGNGLYFNSTNAKLVFPSLKKGQVITIGYANVSSSEAGFSVTNADEAQNSSTHVETLTVKANGDVTVTYKSNKFYIKTIEIAAVGPSITAQSMDDAVYVTGTGAGDVTALSVTATASEGELSYQWYKNTAESTTTPTPTAIAGATTNTYKPLTTAAEEGDLYYFCKVTDTNASVYSNIAKITVAAAAAPTISITASDNDVTAGTSITLTATASGVPTPTLQWYVNDANNTTTGTPVTGETSDTYTFDAVAGTKYYYAIATNASGSVASDVETITAAARTGAKLYEVMYSNKFNAFISEPVAATYYTAEDDEVVGGTKNVGDLKTAAANGTVTAYYLEGQSAPTILSTETSDGATVDTTTPGKIIVTAEDGTTTATYDVTITAVAPYTGSKQFDGTENWIKTGNSYITTTGSGSSTKTYYAWVINRQLKSGENRDADARVAQGKTRIYFFVGEATSITLTNDRGTSLSYDRDINVYVNGDKKSVTSMPKYNEETPASITIPTGTAAMVEISSNQNGGDTGWGKISMTGNTEQSVVITCEGGLASFSCDQNLDFSASGAKAYIVSNVSASSVELTEVTKVPANTGLIVKGTKGETVTATVIDSGMEDVSANKLSAAVTATDVVADQAYGLSKADGKFHKLNAGTIPGGKAYLLADKFPPTAPTVVDLNFDENSDITTGIDTIEHSTLNIEHSEVYNLNGQRVSQPTKGLYIVNGKKVIVK